MPGSAEQWRTRKSRLLLPFTIGSDGKISRRDGYQSPQLEAPKTHHNALGVYIIALFEGAVFLFPSHSENEGKFEAVGRGVLQRIKPKALEIIAGKVEKGEEPHQTAQRETWEERHIQTSPTQFSNSLPPLVVSQKRAGKNVTFNVAGYTLELTAEQAQVLRSQEGVREISLADLALLLQADTLELRPAARAALMAYTSWSISS